MKIISEYARIKDEPQPGVSLKWSIWNDMIPTGNRSWVLFNTVSRNAVLTEHNYCQGPIEDLSEQDKSMLYQLGIIVDATRDEISEQNERFAKGKEDLSYLDLTILVTHNCQMCCSYCFEGGKEKVVVDEHTSSGIMKLLESHAETCRKLRVTWFGGEPLLAYNQMKRMSQEIIRFCNIHGIAYSADITTNGYALNPSRCKELVEEMNVTRFIITVDGPADIHDKRRPLASHGPTFQRIWNNIHSLVDCGAWVTIRMTIDRENRPYIPEFLEALACSSLNNRINLSFCRTIDINMTPEAVKTQLYNEQEWTQVEWELIQIAHHLGLWSYQFPHAAPAGGCLRRGDITIAATGKIYKCLDTVGDERWVCGNIAETSNRQVPSWYQQWMEWSPMDNDRCKHCVLQPLCNGGCPHNALYGDKRHGTSLQCPDWRANYRNQIKEIAKLYEHEKIQG
jgi:uncharacterized protein